MFLKELESWLERGQIVQFLREICPRKKCTPKSGRNITAIARKLLKVLPVGLYVFNGLLNMPVPTYLMKRTVERQLGIESGSCKS
jgi:hypothetical protein